jgi:hypothetical protein
MILRLLKRSRQVSPVPFTPDFLDLLMSHLDCDVVTELCLDFLINWYSDAHIRPQLIACQVPELVLRLPNVQRCADLARVVLENTPAIGVQQELCELMVSFLNVGENVANVCTAITSIPLLVGLGMMWTPKELEQLLIGFLDSEVVCIRSAAIRGALDLRLFTDELIRKTTLFLSAMDEQLISQAIAFLIGASQRWEDGSLGVDGHLIEMLIHIIDTKSFASCSLAVELLIEITKYCDDFSLFERIADFLDASMVGRYALCAMLLRFTRDQSQENLRRWQAVFFEKEKEISLISNDDETDTISTAARILLEQLRLDEALT